MNLSCSSLLKISAESRVRDVNMIRSIGKTDLENTAVPPDEDHV